MARENWWPVARYRIVVVMNEAARAPGNRLVSFARWILVLPTAYLAWTIALLVGIAIHGAIDRICPLDQQVSGHCAAPWYPAVSKVVFAIGAGLAAALIVVMCTLMAQAIDERSVELSSSPAVSSP